MTPRLQLVTDAMRAPTPTRRARAIQPSTGDTYNSHPAFGLTADALLSFHREAERGVPMRQFDCFDDMIEVDGHLRSLVNGRVEAVAGCEMTIMPGRQDRQSVVAAEILAERMRVLDVPELVEHHLMSPHYGNAITNTVWDMVDGVIAPVELVHAAHRRFAAPSAERASEIWLVAGTTSRDLVPLEPGQWCISRYRNRNPWAAGLMRTAAWWSMFKRWSVRDWQVFAEMFGLPLAIGYYEEGASEASRTALEEAIKQIGEDGYAVLASTTEIVVKDTVRGGDSSTVWPAIIALCEAQQSKLFTGATAAVDLGNTGSYAAATVHESRQYALSRRDATRIEQMFSRDIGAWFCRWNGFDRAAAPQLSIQITRDDLQRAQVLQIIGQVVDLDEDQIRTQFSVRKPNGKGVRFPTKTPGGVA